MDRQLVVKSNFLVEASYRLTAIEQKIILTLATKIKKTDEEFQKYHFNFGELAHFLGLRSNADYSYLRNVTHKLLEKVLTLKKEGSIIQTHWLESVEYFQDDSSIALCFNPELKPFLIQLKNNFTKYHLKYAIKLKSRFSIRIYELLKQYETIGSRAFELKELRSRLGIKETEYPLYGNFKAKVLLVAQKELKEKTDLSFTFKEGKTKRKVTSVKFFIKSKNNAVIPEDEEVLPIEFKQRNLFEQEEGNKELLGLFDLVPEKFRIQKTVKSLIERALKRYPFDYVARNIKYANSKSNAAKPGANLLKGSNYRNYLSKALKGDYGLAYEEDMKIQQAIEVERKKQAKIRSEQKKQEIELLKREQDLSKKARDYIKKLSKEEVLELEASALLKLSPEMLKVVKTSRTARETALKRVMEKIIIEQHFEKDETV